MWVKFHEQHYYLSSLNWSASQADTIRGHWLIENRLHWVKAHIPHPQLAHRRIEGGKVNHLRASVSKNTQ
jgi:predicted transposase YbfD/YdcC